MIFVIATIVIFVGFYFGVRHLPNNLSFGWKESLAIGIVLGAIYVLYFARKKSNEDRIAQIKINRMMKNPERLINKLNNPEIEIGGEKVSIKMVSDRDDENNKTILNYTLCDGKVELSKKNGGENRGKEKQD